MNAALKKSCLSILHNGALVPIAGIFILSSVIFRSANTAYTQHLREVPQDGAFFVLGAFLLASVFAGLKTKDLSPPLRIFFCSMAVVFGLYGMAAYIPVVYGNSATDDFVLNNLWWCNWLQFFCMFLTFYRPSFVIVPVFYVIANKAGVKYLFGVAVSATDYMPLVEITLLSITAVCLWFLAKTFFLKQRFEKNTDMFFGFTFIAIVALHMGNYFHSGLAKIYLDGGVLDWAMNNPTYWLAAHTLEAGTLPIAPLLTFIMPLLVLTNPILNWITLVSQLGSIVMFGSLRVMIALTLVFDLMHLVIFLVTGIFFWKWMILNSVLIVCMYKMPPMKTFPGRRVFAGALVLFAPSILWVAKLGWYDSPALVNSYLVAVSSDGSETRVPSNYFSAVSILVAQQKDFGRPAGHYPTGTWGTTAYVDIRRDAEKCVLKVVKEKPRIDIAKLVNKVHAYNLTRLDEKGDMAYDFYPHHIYSNPWLFPEFKALDKRSIRHFELRTDSKCGIFSDNKVHYKVIQQSATKVE